MNCKHDITEMDIAISCDGLCPLCLKTENAKLWKIIVKLERRVDKRGEVLSFLLPRISDHYSKKISNALNYSGE